MEKSISFDQLRNDPDAVFREVGGSDDAVLIERPGAPTVAVISLDVYRRLREAEDRRGREAFAELERLRVEIDHNLVDLSDEARRELADEVSQDVMDRILANGRFRFVGS